jgi:hypothetical protein
VSPRLGAVMLPDDPRGRLGESCAAASIQKSGYRFSARGSPARLGRRLPCSLWGVGGGGATSQSCDPPLSVSVTTYSPYQCNTSPHCREAIMATVKHHASTILGAFEQARTELIGKAVILTDGKAGTVENVWLDEFHELSH